MKPLLLFCPALLALSLPACSAAKKSADAEPVNRYAMMAQETLDSLYSNYGIDGESLLRENYPHDFLI